MGKLPLDQIICGDAAGVMKTFPENSVHAIVTDPPYGLEFMGKEWDKFKEGKLSNRWQQAGKPSMERFDGRNDWHSKPKPRMINDIESMKNYQQFSFEWAAEALRILKPGGHLLSFGGTRTYHRMVCAIEDAGFEIRDCIFWCYGSGFPKSLNIGKAVDKLQGDEREVVGDNPNVRPNCNPQDNTLHEYGSTGKTAPITKGTSEWEGWGTALKPAVEPIVLARKPLSEKSVAENVLKWGTGGLNIDGCRVETQDNLSGGAYTGEGLMKHIADHRWGFRKRDGEYQQPIGRFPANLIHDGSDEVVGLFPESNGRFGAINTGSVKFKPGEYSKGQKDTGGTKDSGSAARFFYCAKASREERNMGLDGFEEKEMPHSTAMKCANCGLLILCGTGQPTCKCVVKKEIRQKAKNIHPTVKPVALMEYLIRLVTREGQLVLDPFVGSGTTCIAARKLLRCYIGIDNNEEYCRIARQRLASIPSKLDTFFEANP